MSRIKVAPMTPNSPPVEGPTEDINAKGNEYSARVQARVWATFVEEFKAMAVEPGANFSLFNKAAAGAFLDCANKLAVDEGLHEDVMAAAVRRSYRVTLKGAAKFGV
jgi:hypothetical protein